MSVYIVAQLVIKDRGIYKQYELGFAEIFLKNSGKLLSVDESPTVLEGHWFYTRTILIEFPSQIDAKLWYDSKKSQGLAQYRYNASDANLVLIRFVEGRFFMPTNKKLTDLELVASGRGSTLKKIGSLHLVCGSCSALYSAGR